MGSGQAMNFSVIDMGTWDRKEYFQHYYRTVRCTYSVTVNMDISKIYARVKKCRFRLYPTLIWWIAKTVNHFPFLRFHHDEEGRVGYYDTVHPSFTYMPPLSDKFHVLWCRYDDRFQAFYGRCVEVIDQCDSSKMFPMQDMPRNCFDISAVPWIEFGSLNLNVFSEGTHLPPIFTTGKLIKEGGQVKLPVCLQVHHAVCDGYHAGQCFSYLEGLAEDPSAWML